MTKHNRFARYSGCFSCRCCGRKSRETDTNSGAGDICSECFELAGIENAISDAPGPEKAAVRARYYSEIANWIDSLRAKGVDVDTVWPSFAVPAVSAPEVMRAEKVAHEDARSSQNASPVIPPTPSLALATLQAERAQRRESYRIIAERLVADAADVVVKLRDLDRISSHDGANLGRTAADLQALAEVIALLDTAIASCR